MLILLTASTMFFSSSNLYSSCRITAQCLDENIECEGEDCYAFTWIKACCDDICTYCEGPIIQ